VYGAVPHLLNSCDTVASPTSTSCNDLVTHADGSLVTAGNPAKPSETIVIYAEGLGRTGPGPLIRTGTAASAPTPTIENFPIAVSYRKEGAGFIAYFSTGQLLDPLYSGLTPNFVGLYQINTEVLILQITEAACEHGGAAGIMADVPRDLGHRRAWSVAGSPIGSTEGMRVTHDREAQVVLGACLSYLWQVNQSET
jgi:hypothetical protein